MAVTRLSVTENVEEKHHVGCEGNVEDVPTAIEPMIHTCVGRKKAT